MDQNMTILIVVVVALSMVTIAIVVLRLPRQILLIWTAVEGLIIFALVAWLYLFGSSS